MSYFSDFMSAFDTFKTNNNLSIDYINSRGYGWRIGSTAKTLLQQHLQDSSDEFSEELKTNFYNLFEKGNDLLGIPVLGTCSGEYTNNIYLYKIGEHKHKTSLEKVDFKAETNVIKGQRVKDPITNMMLYWPCLIKMQSVNITDGKNIMTDEKKDDSVGVFDFSNSEKVINGHINYKTGALNLVRQSNHNIEVSKKAMDFYNNGVAMATKATISFDTDNFDLSCVVYNGTVKPIWTHTIST